MSPRQRLPEPSSGITRIDQEVTRTHGWVGRMGYRRTVNGWRPKFKKFFGDFTHGGPADALKAAEAWLRRTKKGGGAVPPAKKRAAKKGTAKKGVAKKGGVRKAATKRRATRKAVTRKAATRKAATRRPAKRTTRKR